jgi:hypothetical protein
VVEGRKEGRKEDRKARRQAGFHRQKPGQIGRQEISNSLDNKS